jgi:hypothetical protein
VTRHEPFEIVFPMLSPVALNHPWLHLDGVLSHALNGLCRGRESYLLPTKRPIASPAAHSRFRQMLKMTQGVMHASISFFVPDIAPHSMEYFKRFEADRFPRKRKVSLGTGYFRFWCLRQVYKPCAEVRFYGCGDIALVTELMHEITHLGNDTRIGWGSIDHNQIRINRLNEDRSLVYQGKAMRPLPARLCRRYSDAVPLAWRPPYWAAENIELCVPPGADVELNDEFHMA